MARRRNNKTQHEQHRQQPYAAAAAAAAGNDGAAAAADDGDYLFFYRETAEHGEFSQWYPSPFTVSKREIPGGAEAQQPIEEVHGGSNDNTTTTTTRTTTTSTADDDSHDDGSGEITFTSAEQFMMYAKACLFRDGARAAAILASPHPRQQKALGRRVVGFEEAGWDRVKFEVVRAGSRAKFTQNAELGRKLLGTGGATLAEASGRDRVWGIGFREDEAMGRRGEWGLNLLGKALMEVREEMRREMRKGGGGGRGKGRASQ